MAALVAQADSDRDDLGVAELRGGRGRDAPDPADLARLRHNGLIVRVPDHHRYTLTPDGIQFAILYTKAHGSPGRHAMHSPVRVTSEKSRIKDEASAVLTVGNLRAAQRRH